MDLTCLSRGRDIYFPPCYILDVCGTRILIGCPIDLSALAVFSPLRYGSHAAGNEEISGMSVDISSDCEPPVQKRRKLQNPLDGIALISAEPWYKTVSNLHLWNASFIDIVLISSPYAMLGLPFLSRVQGFSAKIYMTEAAAKLGKLMMENLVAMHTEYRQFYGPEEAAMPKWMNWEELESLPSALREMVLGTDGVELGGWMQLYSAADIEDSVKKVETLKYKEEICYNGTIILKASSSGSEIGACNWTIKCPNTSIACIMNSMLGSAHAMEFDYHALRGNDVILYADCSSLNVLEDGDAGNRCAATDNHLSLSNSEDFLLGIDESSEERKKLDFICSTVIASAEGGGSALITIDRLGILLQLLEKLSVQLENSDVKVPIYVISSVAEELLAFTNIIPEWVCKQRQEQFFSGNPLFAHAELIKDGRIQVCPDIYSPKLLTNWQEPCIVFCPHWNLRLGPAVHLLDRWHEDENGLLVLEEGVDSSIALLPFSKTMKMKVLRCSLLSGIKLNKIQPLLDILQPKFVLLPENLTHCMRSSSVIHYYVNKTVRIPSYKDGPEIDIAPELISHLHWRSLKEENMSITRLNGKLTMYNGSSRILPGDDELPCPKGGPVFHWGSPDLQRLLTRLSEMGVSGSLPENSSNKDRGMAAVVQIQEPNLALIEVRKTGTTIVTADRKLASLISEAVSCALGGV